MLYQPEQWRTDDYAFNETDADLPFAHLNPHAREQSRLLDLLGRINYKILSGNRVYVEVGGVVYKTLYGGYWRSVFTGIQHYLLRCEEVSGSTWIEGSDDAAIVDLPSSYSRDGWTARGHSLSLMLSRE